MYIRILFNALGAAAVIGIPMALVYLIGAWIESFRGVLA